MSFVLGRIGIAISVALAVPTPSAQPAPKPEYFGFYALDVGKLIAIADGKAETPATMQPVRLAILGTPQSSQRSAVRIGARTRFILFDAAPGDAVRALSLHRLPFVRHEITVPETSLPGTRPVAQARAVNLHGMLRLSGAGMRLLQKPVPGEPQMIELIPDPALEPGLYGILYAPSGAVASGPAGGQRPGWSAILSVEWEETLDAKEACIDVVMTGGLAGMLRIGSAAADGNNIASFPLLDSNRIAPCSSTGATAAAPPTPPTRLEAMTAAITAGEVVTVPIKIITGFAPNTVLRLGTVMVSKAGVVLTVPGSNQGFTITPDQIYNMTLAGPQLHLHLLTVNPRNGQREMREDRYLLDPGITERVRAGGGRTLNCAACDDSMSELVSVLKLVRGR